MHRITWILLLALLPLLGISQNKTKSALFLGNSYTYFNNMPVLVANIAASKGDSLIHDRHTPGGYTLDGHATNPTSITKINSKNWDFVILQEQSQKPSFPPAQVAADVYPYAEQLDSIIQKNDSCTRTMFYMTWGRKYGDAANCGFYPPLCTYHGMQQRLRDSYVQMANDNDGWVAPVGQAFNLSRSLDSNLNLYAGDNSHPSLLGSYLAACVFYTAIFGDSSANGAYPSGISPAQANYLQDVADRVVFDSLQTWRIDTSLSLDASFTYNFQPNRTIDFVTLSNDPVDHFWNFGDGNTSTLKNPSHTYAGDGNYFVRHIVRQKCSIDSVNEEVFIYTPGIEEKLNSVLSVYPNPNKGEVFIQLDDAMFAQVEIYEPSGKEVLKQRFSSTELIRFQHELPRGVYLIRLVTEESVRRTKLVVE